MILDLFIFQNRNGWTKSEGKKKTSENENNGHLGLGSLKDAPPLPGISSKKEDAHLGIFPNLVSFF